MAPRPRNPRQTARFRGSFALLWRLLSALHRLADIRPHALTIFAASVLYPLFALVGMWLALARTQAPAPIRIYAGMMCAALIAFSAYAALIGWVGARTWTM